MSQLAVNVSVTFHKKTEFIEMLIVPSLTQNIILGMDFWEIFSIKPVICNEINISTPSTELTPDQQLRLKKIVDSFKTTGVGQPLSRTDVLSHHIDTGDSVPVRQRYYPVSPYVQVEMDKELKRMLELKVVEPSDSPWASPIVGVRKSNGELRLCLDARRVNDCSKKNGYPLPYISRILGRLQGTKYLTSIDLKNSFWQIPLTDSSKEKTAFTVPGRGHYQFNVMPFGLCNAAQTQSQLMDKVLGFDMEPCVFNYIDDIVCATSTFEEHLYYLEQISIRLKKANLSINVDKSKFCVPEIKYLGYILTKDGIATNPDKVSAIINYPSPKSVTGVRQLMGMVSWYRRFIKDFSKITAPITDLIKKSNKFVWTQEAEDSLNILKKALSSTPILATPDFDKEFTIQSDACNSGMGAVLTQVLDGHERVIEYMSQKFTDPQRKYTTTEKECLALILAFEKFRPYIEGVRFTAITDHASLLWLRNLKDPTGRLARWSLRMQAYEFNLIHRKGSSNDLPDALSRNISVIDFESPEFENDKWYADLRNRIILDPINYPGLKIQNNLIYKYVPGRPGCHFEWKLIVPLQMRSQILKESHDLPCSSHGGIAKTTSRIKLRYYWPSMIKDIKQYVRVCEVCQTTKIPNITLRHEMGAPKQVTKPWEMVSIDLIGPLPRSKKGYTYLLVLIDIFTKFILVRPLRQATSVSVISFLEENFLTFSVPRVIISDNGSQFVSKAYKTFMDEFGVDLWYTASYHAQANPVERANKVIKTALRAYVSENHKEWDKYIHQVACAMRSAIHDSTKYSPYYLNFGQEMLVNGKMYRLDNELENVALEKSERLERLDLCRKTIQEHLSKAYKTYSNRYNLRSRQITFNVGEIILKRNFQLSDAIKGYTAGLGRTFVKCKVKQKLGKSCYRLENMIGKDIGVFNVKDLNKFHN